MPKLQTDLIRLEKKLAELEAFRKKKALGGDEVEALAECAFRLAVHPATAPKRAIELLVLSMRTDRANPRYPYHLARLFFRSGDLDKAGHWLNEARKLCPTSHRIWTHIGLLQREINDTHNRKYREKKGYQQDEHRHKWKAIAEEIRKGSDCFDPMLARFEPMIDQETAPPTDIEQPATRAPDEPEGLAERLSDAGVCRWNRVLDSVIEDFLEADSGVRTRDMMREMIEQAAANVAARVGGRTLFCVLAIEWILRGYAPEFIERIRRAKMKKSAADLLLDVVLELIAKPPEDLPAAIASALSKDEIPEVLAAAIHRRYVLSPQLNFEKLMGDLRSARTAIRQGSEEDRVHCSRSLTEDTTLFRITRPAPVSDFPAAISDGPELTLQEKIKALTDDLERTKDAFQRNQKWLQDRRTKKLEELPENDIYEADRIRDFVNGLSMRSDAATTELKRLRESGKVQEFAEPIQNLETGWQNLNIGPLRTLLKKYPKTEKPATDPPAPQAAEGSAPTDPTPPEASRDQEVPVTAHAVVVAIDNSNAKDSAAQLARRVEETEKNLIDFFDAHIKTFDAYSPSQRAKPSMQAVRTSIAARKAETLFRFGKRREAHREWSAILREDVFDLGILRNLAICATAEGDIHRYTQRWRDYLEMLYFQATASGKAGHLATEREQFHKNYGNAYGLKYFNTAGTTTVPDETEIRAFLMNPAQARLYMQHQLLAIFNRRLTFTVAPLVLGVTRSASEEMRRKAAEKMEVWSSRMCGLLPPRTAQTLSRTVSEWLAAASDNMNSAKRMRDLAGSKEYVFEQSRFQQWIADVFSWKSHLYCFAKACPPFDGRLEYFDVMKEFYEADAIPIDTSDELLEPVARKVHTSPELMIGIVEQAYQDRSLEVLKFVFPKGGFGDDQSEMERRAIYDRLTQECGDSRIIRHARKLIDAPGHYDLFEFYPPSIHQALQTGRSSPEDLQMLERLHALYPASGGITLHYALLLAHAGKIPEAKKVAARGVATGFDEFSRSECKKLLDQIGEADNKAAVAGGA